MRMKWRVKRLDSLHLGFEAFDYEIHFDHRVQTAHRASVPDTDRE